MQQSIHKYPRTHHIAGSRFQPGDEALDAIPFAQIANRHVVVEEKIDGANCGISFSSSGQLQLQSRGHYLTGGPREQQFTLLKRWANTHVAAFYERLATRYVLYAEWLYAKHTIFYDALPHYLFEFDVLDTHTGQFLSTPCRAELLAGAPVTSVPIVFDGRLGQWNDLTSLLGASQFISPDHRQRLRQHARQLAMDPDRVLRATDPSTTMEGLYIKVEEDGVVKKRVKYIRSAFLTTVSAARDHWMNRPILPNLLLDGVNLFDVS